jgi:hypothetical protein
MDAGLVKGEGFAVDASVIEADASRYHGKATTRSTGRYPSACPNRKPKMADRDRESADTRSR